MTTAPRRRLHMLGLFFAWAALSSACDQDPANPVPLGTTADAGLTSSVDGGANPSETTTILPSMVEGEIMGDAVATIAGSPYTFSGVTFHGSLSVEAGVQILFDGWSRIEGDLSVAAGVKLSCNHSYYFFDVQGNTHLNGTSEAPIELTRFPIGGPNNSCNVRLSSAKVSYTHFLSASPAFGRNSTITDSTISPMGNGGAWTWVHAGEGKSASDVVFTHNLFVATEIRGKGFTAHNNHFNLLDADTAIWLCNNSNCGTIDPMCPENRSCDANVDIRNNVFAHSDVDRDSVFTIGLSYGATDVSNNYFTPNYNPDYASECSGDNDCNDPAGYGGPLVVSPMLDSPPTSYGPR